MSRYICINAEKKIFEVKLYKEIVLIKKMYDKILPHMWQYLFKIRY